MLKSFTVILAASVRQHWEPLSSTIDLPRNTGIPVILLQPIMLLSLLENASFGPVSLPAKTQPEVVDLLLEVEYLILDDGKLRKKPPDLQECIGKLLVPPFSVVTDRPSYVIFLIELLYERTN
jgi:hypothetical protein